MDEHKDVNDIKNQVSTKISLLYNKVLHVQTIMNNTKPVSWIDSNEMKYANVVIKDIDIETVTENQLMYYLSWIRLILKYTNGTLHIDDEDLE